MPSTDQCRVVVPYLIIQRLALAQGKPCIRGGPCFVAGLTPYVGTACRVWMEVRAVRHHTIGQWAKRTRVNVETICYDDRCGPLPQPPRRASGYCQYSQDDVVSLRFIRRAKTQGSSLKEIAALLAKNSPINGLELVT